MMVFRGSAAPLTEAAFDHTRQELGVDDEALWALMTVETRGFGFLPDRRPKILFERHVFHLRTTGRHGAAHPDISASKPGGYLGGAAEYGRLERAMILDRKAALESASWGLGQIMGFNATGLGYESTEAMVINFQVGEDDQLAGVRRFIGANPPLREAFSKKRWARVAFFYNGENYARNDYDRKLEQYHDLYALKGTPSIAVRTAQAWLTYLGFHPRGVDGIVGDGTRTALIAFQKSKGLPVTAELDDFMLEQLRLAAGNGVVGNGA